VTTMAKDILLLRGGRVVQSFGDHQAAIDVARAELRAYPRRVYTIARAIDVLGHSRIKTRSE